MGATQMKPEGIFHTTGSNELRRQVWAGSVNVTAGNNTTIIRNRGQYSRCYFEVFLMAGHGSNGYYYYLANLSRYGTDLVTADGSFSGTVSTSSTNSSQYNGIQLNASVNTNYYIHVNVYYHNTETGLEVDSPAGLSHIGTGV